MSEGKKNKRSRTQWLILLTVIVGTFLGRLDQTIVGLALPDIMSDFKITTTAAGWISTAYILANAIFVPIWGKLGDLVGRKKVYIIGFGLFIVGSVLAGSSWSLSSMIVFRVIQAVAGSADYPTAMAILAVTFRDKKERAEALGIWSASFAAASVFGPLIGGPLIDNFGWRSVFMVNLPVGLLGLAMALAFIPESTSGEKEASFDWWGALTLGGSLSSLVLVLDKGLSWGWFSLESWLCYLAIVIFAAIFYLVERRHPEPIIDFKFFKIPVFVNTLGNNFIIFMGMMGGVYLIPIFAQTFLGYGATETGVMFMPMAAMMMISSMIGGKLSGKVQPRYIIAGSTLMAALGLYCFTYLDPRSTAWDIIWPMSIMAFGMGFGMAERTNIIASAVPPEEIGTASAILALVRNISGAFGIAVFGTILEKSTYNFAYKVARYSTLHVTSRAALTEAIGLESLRAQISGYGTVFLISSIVLVVGAVSALWIRIDNWKRDTKKAASI